MYLFIYFSIIFENQAFMAHEVWYGENMEEKTAKFFQTLKLSKKNMHFGADADISIMKFCCLWCKSMRSL